MSAGKILSAARAEIGTPFRHQGRTPGKALDCAGLVCHVADVIGVEYSDQQGYGRRPSNGLLESALDAQASLDRVEISDMKPGDVLLMKFSGDPQHLAIYAGWSDVYEDDGIIHAWLQAKKVSENRLTDELRGQIVRVYRFKVES